MFLGIDFDLNFVFFSENVEMRQLISELSGIPLDNVEYAKLNGSFPRTLSVLQVHNNLTWSATSTTVDKWPLNIAYDGNIFYYRFVLGFFGS